MVSGTRYSELNSNYCGDRMHSISMVVVGDYELKLYRETP
jgi:hypothetical protein